MKITTVRITDEQHEWIQQHRPQQLSHLIRQHLDELMHMESPVDYHNAWRESAQKCYPHMRGGYCAICWPAGIPSKQEWAEYIKSKLIGDGGGNTARVAVITYEEWMMRKHANRQATLAEWNPPQKKSSWLTRLLRR